jgi:hypothetical protein
MDNRRIERALLDRAESRAPQRVGGDTVIVPVQGKAVESPEFARLITAALRERKGTVSKATLRDLIGDIVKPEVADPQILSSERAIGILEQLLTTVLPQLKESEEFHQLASSVVGEELERRRDLRARCLEDTAA